MEIRATTQEDHDVYVETLLAPFGLFPGAPTEDGGGHWWSAAEMDRNLFAVDGNGKPIGTAGAYTFELTLPGEVVVPMSGVTNVGVLPSHRRQGVLTALMRRQLTEFRARGEFVAGLLASEAVIYRRYGYGPATHTDRLTIQRHQTAPATPRAGATPDTGSIELLPRDRCVDVLAEVYERYRRAQPGAVFRPRRWWDRGAGQPPVSRAVRRIAVHRDAEGIADGYASYAVENRVLTVDEIIATGDAAFAALARLVLDHDLINQVVIKHLPPEHPLRWQLADLRAAELNQDDWLWLRLLDVPKALTARGWSADGELVLDVVDPFLGERGRHLLTVREGKAECVPTGREPDLSLDVSDLGSIYLGGNRPSTLVRAGHIQAHHGDAAARADALFHTERPPHCVHWF